MCFGCSCDVVICCSFRKRSKDGNLAGSGCIRDEQASDEGYIPDRPAEDIDTGRSMEIPALPVSCGEDKGFLCRKIQRFYMGNHPCTWTLGTERLRRSSLCQCGICLERTFREQSALRSGGKELCRTISPHLRHAG